MALHNKSIRYSYLILLAILLLLLLQPDDVHCKLKRKAKRGQGNKGAATPASPSPPPSPPPRPPPHRPTTQTTQGRDSSYSSDGHDNSDDNYGQAHARDNNQPSSNRNTVTTSTGITIEEPAWVDTADYYGDGDIPPPQPRTPSSSHPSDPHVPRTPPPGTEGDVQAYQPTGQATALGALGSCQLPDGASLGDWLLHQAELKKQGKISEAVQCLIKGVQVLQSADAVFELAKAFHEVGDHAQATRAYVQATTFNPQHAMAHLLAGNLAASLDQNDEALKYFHRAAELRPDSGIPYNNIGLIYQKQKQDAKALEMFERAIAIQPNSHMAYNNAGNIYKAQGQSSKARDAFAKAFELDSTSPEAAMNVASMDLDMGNHARAMRILRSVKDMLLQRRDLKGMVDLALLYQHGRETTKSMDIIDTVLQYDSKNVNALKTRASHYRSTEQPQMALADLRILVEHAPSAEIFAEMGDMLYGTAQYKQAAEHYEKALQLDSGYPVFNGLASAHLMLRDLNSAIHWYRKAMVTTPTDPLLRGNLIHALGRVCEWETWEDDMKYMRQLALSHPGHVNTFHVLAYSVDPSHILRVARSRARPILNIIAKRGDKPIYPSSARIDDVPSFSRRQAIMLSPSRPRLRIGYVSSDFNDHPVGHLCQDLFGLHDRTHFEVFCYATQYAADTGVRHKIAQTCDHFLEVHDWSTARLARRIDEEDQIQILVNMNGYTMMARDDLFAMHAAPLQVLFLGYASTLGAPYIQYLITDPISTPPEIQDGFAEKMIYMPHNLLISSYRDTMADVLQDPPQRSDHGFLPADESFLFCNFNNLHKLDPRTFTLWMEIMRQVPASQLWLQRTPKEAESRLRAEAQRAGVDSDRLIFTDHFPRDTHLKYKSMCQLFLDTYEYNAHTTGAEALWAAVPILTLRGHKMVSRVAASLVSNVGLSTLIARDPVEYVRKAVYLASNREAWKQLHDTLIANRLTQPLFDTKRWVGNLERGYKQIWETYQSGQAPMHVSISEDEQ